MHMQKQLILSPAIQAAEYYGFQPFESLAQKKHEEGAPKRSGKESKPLTDIAFIRPEEKSLVSAAKLFSKHGIRSRAPHFLWRVLEGDTGTSELELHILNVPTGMAEALLITLAHSIAEEAGVAERVLHINSFGTAESSGRYVRDVNVFLRKHIEEIPSGLRAKAPTDPLGTLHKLVKLKSPLMGSTPQAMEYLNEEERKHLWDVLEYLEASGLYYELNGHIIGSRDIWTHTLFELNMLKREEGDMATIARGGRYDALAARFVGHPLHATMLSLTCSAKGKAVGKRAIPSSLYFAHLGLEARRKSFKVLETLRKAQIPVAQSLTFEQLSDQMRIAKEMKAPYLLIMGHKEAVEGTVLVRDTYTNMQNAVPLPELPTYLKRNKIVRI